MFYLLHHAKGALILSADDRDQVVEWSKRQLGPHARQVSVIETNPKLLEEMVERSGTGMLAESIKGCRPVMSITADSPTGRKSDYQEKIDICNTLVERRKFAREAIWH
jgi:hypothetical protein